MRGKAFYADNRVIFKRITPAYAGKSPLVHLFKRHLQDHPRLCGEKEHIELGISILLGSPPPMRGKERV